MIISAMRRKQVSGRMPWPLRVSNVVRGLCTLLEKINYAIEANYWSKYWPQLQPQLSIGPPRATSLTVTLIK